MRGVTMAARSELFASVRRRLEKGYERVLATIDWLADGQLLEAGIFGLAGKPPVARGLSINSARQGTTARPAIRRAMRQRERAGCRRSCQA